MRTARPVEKPHPLALLAYCLTAPDAAAVLEAEDMSTSAELELLAALHALDEDDELTVFTRLVLAGASDAALDLAEWLADAPNELRDQGARVIGARRESAALEPVGALAAWRRLVRSGKTPHPALTRAACREADAGEFAAMRLFPLAARCMEEARAIVLAAADQERAA